VSRDVTRPKSRLGQLEKLRKGAIQAEQLRCRYDQEVILVIGCEFMLFTPGIIPGADFFEWVEYLKKGELDIVQLQRRFRAFTERMVKVARSNFKGRITYGAAADLERVDWSLFDIVGLDYYSYHSDRADHTAELARFRRWGKPNHLAAMLDVFTDEGLLGASPYTFISPDAPHRPDDRPHDEDIAALPYTWEPKRSFDAVSRFYLTH
jgi:hypothetical protein